MGLKTRARNRCSRNERSASTSDAPAEDAPLVCFVCGKVLDSPPTGYYPTREEFEREADPPMAMLRAMEVMEVHRSHG